MKCKIFEENNKGASYLENEMNDFFSITDIKVLNMNVVVEKVDGIDYKSIIICYEEKNK